MKVKRPPWEFGPGVLLVGTFEHPDEIKKSMQTVGVSVYSAAGQIRRFGTVLGKIKKEKEKHNMPRGAVNLSSLVMRFYLTAPLAEIDGIQPALREIYNHRSSLAARSKAGRAAAATPAKGKGKGKAKKVNAAPAGEAAGFGNKETVEQPTA